MATKTIVCPECQAPAAPGRFACAHCGALLASVAPTVGLYGRSAPEIVEDVAPDVKPANVPPPRQARPTPSIRSESATQTLVTDRPRRTPRAPAWTQSMDVEPVESPPGAEERWDDQLPPSNGTAKVVMAPSSHSNGAAAVRDEPTQNVVAATVSDVLGKIARTRAPRKAKPVVEVAPAPVQAAPPAVVPKVRPRPIPDSAALDRIAPLAEPLPVAEPAPLTLPAPVPSLAALAAPPLPRREPAARAAAPVAPSPRVEPASRVESAPRAEPPALRPVEPRPEPAPARPVPGWPPPGDRGPLAEPASRAPAGAYLPPSAVLPPGEALPIEGAANGRPAEPGLSTGGQAAGSSSAPTERRSAADRLTQFDLPADTPRRIVAIGAVVAVLGFVLPWTASPVGNDTLSDYWVRWGMAGSGAWIVVLLLVGLAGLTLAGGRFATTPVGLPGFGLAMLLLGLVWPFLFGYPARAVGLWVVVAGVLLLAIGGLLDMRDERHGRPQPTV